MAVDVSQTKDLVMRWASQVHEEASSDLRDELVASAPLGQTGDTRRGIELIPAGSPDHPASTIRSTSPHGDFVEEGTAPHEIVPRNAKVLRFMAGTGRISTASPNQRVATRGSGVVFAAHVDHPGTPPRPWFYPVTDRWPEFLQRAAAGVTVTG